MIRFAWLIIKAALLVWGLWWLLSVSTGLFFAALALLIVMIITRVYVIVSAQ